jgi:hypothetical protein
MSFRNVVSRFEESKTFDDELIEIDLDRACVVRARNQIGSERCVELRDARRAATDTCPLLVSHYARHLVDQRAVPRIDRVYEGGSGKPGGY